MTIWVFSEDRSFLESSIEEGEFPVSESSEIPSAASLVVYLTDEEAMVGPFEIREGEGWSRGNTPERIPFETTDGPYIADIDLAPYQDMFSEGGVFDGRNQEIIETKLNSATSTIEMPETDGESSESDEDHQRSLLEISKASEPIDASGRDFSGEAPKRVVLDGNDFREASFTYADLEGTCFDNCDLRGADFTGANLRGATFLDAKLDRTDFSDSKLHGATLDGKLSRCHFEGAVMEGIDLRKATLQEVDLSDVHMPDAELQGTRPIDATFDHSNLKDIKTDPETDFHDASFKDVTLDGTNLSECDLSQTDFEGASLEDTNLSEPNLDGATFIDANLKSAEFDGQTIDKPDFTRADLTDAKFRRCKFEDARFHGARLTDANFQDADVSGGIMSEAKAGDATFDGANLEKVAFNQAELFGASFKGAALYGTILQSARIGSDTEFHGDSGTESGSKARPSAENRSATSGDTSETTDNGSTSYVLYDPRDENPTPEGVEERAHPLDKARSVYRTLETVMQQNAYGDRTSTYLLHRKEMDRRKYLDEGNLGRYLINRMVYYSCGFGESIKILSIWALVIPGFLAVVYPCLGLSHQSHGTLDYATVGAEGLIYGLLFSISAFTGLGYGQFAIGGIGEALATIETGLGVVWFALLVFVLTRRTDR